MKKRKLYLDSSVLGFAVHRRATDRREEANRLLRQIRDGHFVGGYSFVLEDEIFAAPHRVAERLRHKVEWARLHRISVLGRNRSHDLAQKYCEARIVPWEYFDDALHIAVATLWRASALVSYNFAYIGDFRVFYDVVEEHETVIVVAVGQKRHDVLQIGGEEIKL